MTDIRLSSSVHAASDQATPPFELLLPAIKRAAERAFRYRRASQRSELIADVVARAYALFRRLVDCGRAALAYGSVLARYAIRQVISGRRLGTPQNARDVLSDVAQRKRGFRVNSCSSLDRRIWEDATSDDRASPADIAAFRVDLAAWLGGLGNIKRSLAERLIAGDTTNEAARFFRLSPSRISQLRWELHQSWGAFHGDMPI